MGVCRGVEPANRIEGDRELLEDRVGNSLNGCLLAPDLDQIRLMLPEVLAVRSKDGFPISCRIVPSLDAPGRAGVINDPFPWDDPFLAGVDKDAGDFLRLTGAHV